ncbi:hypothetical protein ALISP_4038 [Alicycliphilus sp. B1]|nr:hypothetical protein ALISP_4038 [Alicycliphilus sp. B1]
MPAHQLGDQAELDEVLGLDVLEHLGERALFLALDRRAEAYARRLGTVFDHLLQARERAAADEQDVSRVDLQEVLVRVLAPALGRHAGHGALDELEQRLLHALARHVARDAGVVGLAADLVDLVDVDDAALGALHVVVAALQQLLDDVLHVLAHVAGLGQRGGVGHHEGHVQLARQRLRQQRLARTRGADEQYVALGQLHVVLAGLVLVAQALVVVVHGHGQRTLGLFLADHVAVEVGLDLGRRGQIAATLASGFTRRLFVADDLVAQVNALVANKD